MTPTQQALALDALQSIVEQHDGYCEHHIGATTLSFALAHTASDALAAIASLEAAPAAPIDMVLHCPKCGLQHIDAQEPNQSWGDLKWSTSDAWDNPPHRSHLCHGCGHIWRPADVCTNGVQAVKTRGKADSAAPAAVAEPAEPNCQAILDSCTGYAQRLAESMASKHYPTVTQFRVLPYLLGVLTQIDNMSSGLVRATPPPTEPSAEPIRCAGCDIPNGCPEYCRCAPASPEPSAEVVLPEPAVWKITTKNGNVIYETATPEDVYTSQWLAICNVSPLYTAEQVRAARGVKP